MLHGSLKADDETVEVPEFRVSYKPQKISPKFPGSVRFIPLPCPLSLKMQLLMVHEVNAVVISDVSS